MAAVSYLADPMTSQRKRGDSGLAIARLGKAYLLRKLCDAVRPYLLEACTYEIEAVLPYGRAGRYTNFKNGTVFYKISHYHGNC